MADGDVPAAPGNTNTTALATGTWTAVEIQTLTFVGHHGLINDNDRDWGPGGYPLPDPLYTKGTVPAPVSITAGSALTVQMTVVVSPADAPELPCEIVGAASGWTQSWHASGVSLRGGTNTVKLDSGEATGTSVRRLDGDMVFGFNNGKDPAFSIKVAGVEVCLTAGTPTDRPTWEKGLTRRHMERAVARVAATGADDPHAIVAALMKLVPGYTLIANPNVPPEFRHPYYMDNGIGGAWPIDAYLQYRAECQAICRWVLAMAMQVGLAGTGECRIVWCDPDDPSTPQDDPLAGGHGLHDKTRSVGSEAQRASLLDSHVEVGGSYNVTDGNAADYVGTNKFECCLRYERDATVRYFGGGAGTYKGPAEVLYAFHSLAWIAPDPKDPRNRIVVREVVRRWRGPDGNVLEGG
jgi:hypothetical protein